MQFTAAILICLAPIAHDGDTVRCGNTKTSVRIFGIQAPEIGMAGALTSRDALQVVSAGGLLCEPVGTNYSRVVARCFNSSGVDVGLSQLASSHAVEWCSYSKNFYQTCPLSRRRK